jgi:hypothetical protein
LISQALWVPQLPVVKLSSPCGMNIPAKIKGNDIVVELLVVNHGVDENVRLTLPCCRWCTSVRAKLSAFHQDAPP